LKELRKEDHMQSYKKYFELSDTITTRDKDAITKSFSGLVKVIYPTGEFTEEEAIELMDFSIENRMRVKQQLIKMDETFEEVDFSYKVLSSAKKRNVQTLEVLEFEKPDEIVAEEESKPEQASTVETKKELAPGQRIIRDNQTGISYKSLFGDYLIGATEINIIDPYVRLPYQLRNFMELCKLIASTKREDEEVRIHLTTNNNEDYVENARDSFREMAESLEPLGIFFNFEFDENIHDRSMELNNGWKILLGRGLDIWQKTSGWYDIAEYYQEKRLCKACEITFLKN
jgi:ATP-dependent Lon protease